ncbi:GlxA family transcriptional regulator [Bradyrhizobium sp.]|uniref:GlxA family transcriptional regulator n=1 Tax=Bradyrhizobium sp. TaxID=376 RepID=UPI0025C2F103|nr:GlxA family transcriptional regulator [Bradyrhizobium sp.]
MSRRIVLLLYPGIELLDVVGPLEVFEFANRVVNRDCDSRRTYSIEMWAAESGVVLSHSNVGLMASHSFGDEPNSQAIDTLLVPGCPSPKTGGEKRCVDWIRKVAPHARRVGGICTGAFLLAEAGFLGGRRATTHWAFCKELARQYPAVEVDPDPIFIRDGRFYTSAGVTAGMDLALAMVQDDLGRKAALAVAQRLVLFLKRPGGQAQFSASLNAQAAGTEKIEEVQNWILDNLDRDLGVGCLADRAGMSRRNFVRVFTKRTGQSPASFVDAARLESARRQLEDSQDRIEVIAMRSGFHTPETMRRVFQRRLGVSPKAYRDRFHSAN